MLNILYQSVTEGKPKEYDSRKFGLRKLSQCNKSMEAQLLLDKYKDLISITEKKNCRSEKHMAYVIFMTSIKKFISFLQNSLLEKAIQVP